MDEQDRVLNRIRSGESFSYGQLRLCRDAANRDDTDRMVDRLLQKLVGKGLIEIGSRIKGVAMWRLTAEGEKGIKL